MNTEQQKVIDWLNAVNRAGGISSFPGGFNQFQKSLMGQLDALSVTVPGQTRDAVTLLYSGPIGDQSGSGWKIAESLGVGSNGKVVTIGQTPLGALQNSDEFLDALKRTVGQDQPLLLRELTAGIRADGSRVESIWDRASARLAHAAQGDVRTLTPGALDGKVFAQIELPALLENDKVTHINGVDREVYRHIHATTPGPASAKLSAVNQAIQHSSHQLTREMRWQTVPDPVNGALYRVDPGQLFEGTPYTSPPRVATHAADFDMRSGVDAALTPEQRLRIENGERLTQAASVHLQARGGPHIRTGTVLKGLGVAGTAYGLYEGYGEIRNAIDGAQSTREQHVRGAEASADTAVRGGVAGTAAVVGGAVGGAGGTLVAPGPGTAAGAVVVGGAAAFGAEHAYEGSRLQQWSRALGRQIGELSYDHFTDEGRLLRRLEGLKQELAQAGTAAERERIQGELGTVGEAFKTEVDRNNAYFDGRRQIEQQWPSISSRFPGLDKDDLHNAHHQRWQTGAATPADAVRGAYSDAVHEHVQPRALPHVPTTDYRPFDTHSLQQAWQRHTGEVAQQQRRIDAMEAQGPQSNGVPLLGTWLGQRQHNAALEDLRNDHWRHNGHRTEIEAEMQRRGMAPPVQQLQRVTPAAPAPAAAAPVHLDPTSRQLLADSEQAVAGVAAQHRLSWDQGMTNTVYAVAASARAAGLERINLFNATDGVIRAGHHDGLLLRETTLDAREAANTPHTASAHELATLARERDTALAHIASPDHAPAAARSMA